MTTTEARLTVRRRELLERLRTGGPVTSSALAAELELPAGGIRRDLLYLVQVGLATRHKQARPPGSGAGRHPQVYRAARFR